MTEEEKHVPVLLEEVLEALRVKPDGFYIDGTLGGGGHTLTILSRLEDGRLMAFDRDPKAIAAIKARAEGRGNLELIHENFGDIGEVMDQKGYGSADGFLFDLGLSSMQLSRADMGLSFQLDGPLDMRYDPEWGGPDAAEIINSWTERELSDLFFTFGETWAKKIARDILKARSERAIETSGELAAIVKRSKRGKSKLHPATKVFMALRSEVNGELEALKKAIPAAIERCTPGGRIAIICYNSNEDRMVKDRFRRAARGCKCELPDDECMCQGKPAVKIITRKPIYPSEEEIRSNPRSRSGRLRVAERI